MYTLPDFHVSVTVYCPYDRPVQPLLPPSESSILPYGPPGPESENMALSLPTRPVLLTVMEPGPTTGHLK